MALYILFAYSKVTFDLFIHLFVFQSISPSWWLPVKEFAQRIIKVIYLYTCMYVYAISFYLFQLKYFETLILVLIIMHW